MHNEKVRRAVDSMPATEDIDGLSDFFKIFSDPTRVRILLALDSGEMCVCDISEALSMSMSATSHQLRMLRDADLVTCRKEGKNAFYSLCDDHVRTVLEMALEHVREAESGPRYESRSRLSYEAKDTSIKPLAYESRSVSLPVLYESYVTISDGI